MPLFRKLPLEVEAIAITQVMAVKCEHGLYKGKPGDWLITSPTGEEYFIADHSFRESYEPVDDVAKKYLEEVKQRHKYGF
jgi:hypothetical protein